MSNLRERYLTAVKRVTAVELPEWGTTYIRAVPFIELVASVERLNGDKAGALVEQIRLAVCDQDGNPVFTADDVPALRQLPQSVAVPLIEAIERVNAVTPDGVADAGNS